MSTVIAEAEIYLSNNITLVQESINIFFSLKGQIVNIFAFVSQKVLVLSTQLCCILREEQSLMSLQKIWSVANSGTADNKILHRVVHVTLFLRT